MSRSSMSKLKIKIARAISSPRPRRFHVSFRRSSAITLPVFNVPGILLSSKHAEDILRNQKLVDLQDSIGQHVPNPSRVWGQYTDLLGYLEFDHLPLEIHQAVLRKCIPSVAVLRGTVARRVANGNPPRVPHIYEVRLKAVMGNIRAAGHKPTLSDYHYILELFAAVGHHKGALQVYNELTLVFGLTPTPKTYGLCLQTIARRLSLPIFKFARQSVVDETAKMCQQWMKDMAGYKLPFTSVNLDLAIRVLKEIADEPSFTQLMKVGYGIDLDNPDHPPLEMIVSEEADLLTTDGLVNRVPFSTAALNTTVDMLGRFGNVSKLVQTFEVLTQPLPPQANTHFSMSFDDEDDFGVVNPASTKPYQAPHAKPNTTTYNLLLKHISRAGHATFARHYLVQAMGLDRQTDRDIRSQIRYGVEGVLSPSFAINKGTIIPVFGEANRDKNMQLMRWVGWVARQTIRRKQNDIAFYSAARQRHQQQLLGHVLPSPPHPPPTLSRSQSEPSPPPPTPASSNFDSSQTPSHFPSPCSEPATGSQKLREVPKYDDSLSAVLDIDLDFTWKPSPPPVKYFDIDAHLDILQRDLDQIQSLNQQIAMVTARTTQRVKERLGRRVWLGKDIYMRDSGARSTITRKTWADIVNFHKPDPSVRKALSAKKTLQNKGRSVPRYSRPGWLAGQQGLAMSRYVDRVESS